MNERLKELGRREDKDVGEFPYNYGIYRFFVNEKDINYTIGIDNIKTTKDFSLVIEDLVNETKKIIGENKFSKAELGRSIVDFRFKNGKIEFVKFDWKYPNNPGKSFLYMYCSNSFERKIENSRNKVYVPAS